MGPERMSIPTELLTLQPMLACPAKDSLQQVLSRSRLIFDVKWDGIRALLYVDDGQVRIRSRNDLDITARYPDVVAAAQAVYPTGSRVFDGEIVVCNNETKRFDFGLALKRDAQSNRWKIATMAARYPATFMAFDLLWRDGVDFRTKPLHQRLLKLQAEPVRGGLQLSLNSSDGQVMWKAVEQFGFEGLVAKEANSTYRAGRSSSWTKLKDKKRVTAIVTGFEYGEGARTDLVGALHLSLLRDGEPIAVGKVGTGFKRTDHAPLLSVLRAGHEFLVEIEYLEATRELQLRQPSFKGVRVDRTREDCTVEQLR